MNESLFPVSDDETLRSIACGRIIGFKESNGCNAWLGIPYARPPVGPLRWRAPRPAPPWEGIRSALRFGSRSLQPALNATLSAGAHAGSEDCLYLNVWSPSRPRDASGAMPVMVWIHGGGNIFGGSDSYNGAQLAQSQSVIVVSINYRLGPMGWFLHPALCGTDATPEDRSGNYGLLDIIFALRWIRENISAFGGDPDRITVFGESGGAWNIRALLVSPAAAGLFQRAIVQSSALPLCPVVDAMNYVDDEEPGHPQSSAELLVELLQRDGKAKNRAQAKAFAADMGMEATAAYLREKPFAELESAYIAIGERWKGNYALREKEDAMKVGKLGATFSAPKVFADGVVVSKGDFKALLDAGIYNKVPVIFGSTRDEDRAFLSLDADYVSRGGDGKPVIKDLDRYLLVSEYLSLLWKAAGVDEPAQAIARHQRDVFVYRFDWDEQGVVGGIDFSTLQGAGHGIELSFVFGGPQFVPGIEAFSMHHALDELNTEGFVCLSQAVMSYWAEFAYTGNPGTGRRHDLPAWSAWEEGAQGKSKMLIMDAPASGGIRMSDQWCDKKRVLAGIRNDARVAGFQARCGLYQDIFRYGITRLTAMDYTMLEEGRCEREHPLREWI